MKSIDYEFVDNVGGVSDTAASLFRWSSSAGEERMANINSQVQQAGWTTLTDNTIDLAVIDNVEFTYYAEILLFYSSDELKAGRVVVTYEHLTP